MLVENTQSNHRQIGSIYLGPGVSQVDKKTWDEQMVKGYKRSVDRLVDAGILSIKEDGKVTIAVAANTYDIPTLRAWLVDAKGPLKGAIKKQISSIIGDEAEKEAV